MNVFAHSYGTHPALTVLNETGSRVDNLVTVDPVSRSGNYSRPPGVVRWLNILAIPLPGEGDGSDLIASIGGWRGSEEGADANVAVRTNHDEFGKMMNEGGGAAARERSYRSWSIDAGTVTGSRAQGTRIGCQPGETVC